MSENVPDLSWKVLNSLNFRNTVRWNINLVRRMLENAGENTDRTLETAKLLTKQCPFLVIHCKVRFSKENIYFLDFLSQCNNIFKWFLFLGWIRPISSHIMIADLLHKVCRGNFSNALELLRRQSLYPVTFWFWIQHTADHE